MTEEKIYNERYARAKNGEIFNNLMPLVLSRKNIAKFQVLIPNILKCKCRYPNTYFGILLCEHTF